MNKPFSWPVFSLSHHFCLLFSAPLFRSPYWHFTADTKLRRVTQQLSRTETHILGIHQQKDGMDSSYTEQICQAPVQFHRGLVWSWWHIDGIVMAGSSWKFRPAEFYGVKVNTAVSVTLLQLLEILLTDLSLNCWKMRTERKREEKQPKAWHYSIIAIYTAIYQYIYTYIYPY